MSANREVGPQKQECSLFEIRKAPGPADISLTPSDSPTQPVLREYPTVLDRNGDKRSFLAAWFGQHSWLEYSQTENAAFCFACRHFCHSDKAEETFVRKGFQNWKKAHNRDKGLTGHQKAELHVAAMTAWCEYKKLKITGQGSVAQMQSAAYSKQVSENRHYLQTVAEVLLLTAAQNVSQRGHRENDSSSNEGNFKAILNLVVRHDPKISTRFRDSSLLSRYTSHDIQNEIFETLAAMMREQIIDEIKSAMYFSVLADETKDLSKTEQISIVLRYFFKGEIRESFMEFKPLIGLDAVSLSQLILNRLNSYGLDVKSNLVGQGYDGASVMSGERKGVQQRVKESAPLAIYVHCWAHRLNLVLVDSCKSVREAADFFALLERLYVFTSGSVVHVKWIAIQKECYPDEAPRQLKRLSDTRWSCRIEACRVIRDRLDVLVHLLEEIVNGDNRDRAVDACGLLGMIDFKFVLMLYLFCDLLGKTQLLSLQLQSKSLDMSKAIGLVQTLTDTLRDCRDSDESVSELFRIAEEKSKAYAIPIHSHNLTRTRVKKIPTKFNSSVVMETVGHSQQIVHDKILFRQRVYIPVIDCLLTELDNRFSAESNAAMKGVQALTPGHALFMDIETLKIFAEFYHSNMEDIGHEVHQLRRLLQRADNAGKVMTLLDLIHFVEPYRLAFHELYKLLNIAVVLPVTSASCERSFSALKLIKTHLRTTMCNDRLSNIAILSIESGRLKSLDLNEFVDEFDAKHNNRRLLLH